MAETQEQAEARIRLRDPFPQHDFINGVAVAMTRTRYDAWITQSASNEIAQQEAAEAAAALKLLRQQVRQRRQRLQQIATASGTFSNAQRDAAIKDVAQYLNELIGVLIDLDLIERTD